MFSDFMRACAGGFPGVFDNFFGISEGFLRPPGNLFIQTLGLLLFIANHFSGFLLNLARDVFDSALDLIFVHDGFSLKRIERITTSVNQLMTHGLTLRSRQEFICALAHIDSIFQHVLTVRAAINDR